MTTPRPAVIFALLGALLLAVTFQVTRSARSAANRDAGQPTPAAQPTSRASPQARPAVKRKGADRRKGANRRQGAIQARERERRARSKTELPDPVRRAIGKRVVLLFFYQPGSADDDATGAAVDEVRGTSGVATFSVPVTRVARYREVIDPAGVSQAPAIVIVDRERRVRLLEGFVDGETLRQSVEDAR